MKGESRVSKLFVEVASSPTVKTAEAKAESENAETHEHFEHEDTEGVPVDTLVVSTRLHNLGSEVIGSTYERETANVSSRSRISAFARALKETNHRGSK